MPAWLVVGGLVAVLAVPLVVGLAVLRDPSWFPHGDLAQIEMRVRDVASSHQPLLGPYGRMEGFGARGNHPGPLGFVALWPAYRVLGADGGALQVSSAALALVACGLAITIGYRRGGRLLALTVAATLALLARAYGTTVLVQPWNPQLPVLWWVVFVLAVWAVLDDDLPMLPVAVFAGSFCLQNHVSYAAPVGALAAVALAGLAGLAVRAVRSVRTEGGAGDRRRLTRWVGASAALLALLWLPPLLEQVTNRPGNAAIIVESFTRPADERLPFSVAVELFFAHLDLGELVTTDRTTGGSSWPGALLLAVWAGCAAVAVRRRDRSLCRLHVVVGVAALSGLLAVTRLTGFPYTYLTLWLWGTAALMVLAVVWSVVSWGLAGSRLRSRRAVAAGLAAVTVAFTLLFSIDATSSEMPNRDASDNIRELTAATLEVLRTDPAGCGDGCRYLVTTDDPVHIGAEHIGVILALERAGVAARGAPRLRDSIQPHRVIEPAEADAVVHVAVGERAIAAAEADPGARLIEVVDPPPEQRAEYRDLRRSIIHKLLAGGRQDLARQVARQEMITVSGPLPDAVAPLVDEANEADRPRAVYLLPPQGG